MAKETTEKSIFELLNSIDCREKTEKKGDLSYLSWAWAWTEVAKRCDASYEIVKDENGLPYFYDERSGIMCYTRVTINNKTHEMWLPVMDSQNRAMKFVEQKYKTYNKWKNTYEEKIIAAATMFDVNKTIMRCLTKNLAMFGLGLYIYAGEDLPEVIEEEPKEESKAEVKKAAPKATPKVEPKAEPKAEHKASEEAVVMVGYNQLNETQRRNVISLINSCKNNLDWAKVFIKNHFGYDADTIDQNINPNWLCDMFNTLYLAGRITADGVRI